MENLMSPGRDYVHTARLKVFPEVPHVGVIPDSAFFSGPKDWLSRPAGRDILLIHTPFSLFFFFLF